MKADLVLKPGLTHEVMVAKGGMFTFYRNGVVVKSVPSPRPVTDCDGDVVLLGNPSIALASVNFYARGLQANEVRPYPSPHTQMHSHITARPCTHSIARAHTHTHTHTSSSHLSLSYAAARTQVAEMYVGGQPLSELATGSVLPQVPTESADQIMDTVRAAYLPSNRPPLSFSSCPVS